MKKFILVSLITLATMLFTHQGYSQGTVAPLYLSTFGSGSITPLQNGQLLTVGQDYEMTSIPDAGYVFSGWQSVNLFVFTEVLVDPVGNVSTRTSLVASPVPTYIDTPTLTFMMQSPIVLEDVPGVRSVTEGSGWQANFTPVPEPTNAALVVCGFMAIVLLRHRRSTIPMPPVRPLETLPT